MAHLTITTEDQTKVPEEIRERLGVDAGDLLQWEVVPGGAKVSIAGSSLRGVMSAAAQEFLKPALLVGSSFLDLRGAIPVGPGSAVRDVQLARKMRGTVGE